MHVNRKGNEIVISFDTEEEAVGLYAFLSGTVHEVPAETATKGQWIYTWFFSAIQKLATNFGVERSITTQSPETMLHPATTTSVTSSPKRTRKR